MMDESQSEYSGIDNLPNKEKINADEILKFGDGFFGTNLDSQKLESILEKGIMPEKWVRSSGFNGMSFDSVCLTIIPEGENAKSRFDAMSAKQGNMNDFVDGMLQDERPVWQPEGTMFLGFVVDLPNSGKIPGIDRVKINGYLDPARYPTDHIEGIDDHQLVKGKRGGRGGFAGEVRLEFTDEKQDAGITQDLWSGLVVKEKDLPVLKK